MWNSKRRQPNQNMVWVPKNKFLETQETEFEFPLTVYDAISSHLDAKYQPVLRRLSRLANSSYFDTQICFQDITQTEIANWLLDQQRLIREDIKRRTSQFWELNSRKTVLSIQLNYSRGVMPFYIDLNTGGIMYVGCEANTVESIVHYLPKYRPIIDFTHEMNNWKVILEILKNRTSCYVYYGLTPHKVLIQMISNSINFKKYEESAKLSPPIISVAYFKDLLSPLGREKFHMNILSLFGIDFLSEQFEYRKPERKFNETVCLYETNVNFKLDAKEYDAHLKNWVLTLLPEDLNLTVKTTSL